MGRKVLTDPFLRRLLVWSAAGKAEASLEWRKKMQREPLSPDLDPDYLIPHHWHITLSLLFLFWIILFYHIHWFQRFVSQWSIGTIWDISEISKYDIWYSGKISQIVLKKNGNFPNSFWCHFVAIDKETLIGSKVYFKYFPIIYLPCWEWKSSLPLMRAYEGWIFRTKPGKERGHILQ